MSQLVTRISRESRSADSRHGSALVGALIIVFVLGGLVMGLLRMGTAFNREQKSQERMETATQICEAGLTEALVAFRLGGTGNVGSQADPARFGNGLLWTEVEDVANDLVMVKAASMIGEARGCLVQLVFHYNDSLFDTTIFSNRAIDFPANVVVDSFHSDDGTYDDQLALLGGGYVSDGATIQSNSDLEVGATSEIYGDAHPGEESEIDVAGNSDVSGSTEPMAETRVLPPIDVPLIGVGGPLNVAAPNRVLASGDHGFTDITTLSGTALTITGPARILVTNIDIASNSSLIFDTALGDVELYVLGDLDFDSNASVITTGFAATGLTIYLAGPPGQTATFHSNGDFYGAIYGPDATVDINSNFELHGAVAAEEVVLASNTQIHYDEALRDDGLIDRFIAGHMVRGTFPDPALLVNRTDPFKLLGVQRGALRAPADAHEATP
ncbi:MAG: hypothetical protein ACI8QZ_003979 [Chlamydiales bacterium]|jgi:hypothetical protein